MRKNKALIIIIITLIIGVLIGAICYYLLKNNQKDIKENKKKPLLEEILIDNSKKKEIDLDNLLIRNAFNKLAGQITSFDNFYQALVYSDNYPTMFKNNKIKINNFKPEEVFKMVFYYTLEQKDLINKYETTTCNDKNYLNQLFIDNGLTNETAFKCGSNFTKEESPKKLASDKLYYGHTSITEVKKYTISLADIKNSYVELFGIENNDFIPKTIKEYIYMCVLDKNNYVCVDSLIDINGVNYINSKLIKAYTYDEYLEVQNQIIFYDFSSASKKVYADYQHQELIDNDYSGDYDFVADYDKYKTKSQIYSSIFKKNKDNYYWISTEPLKN